MQNGTEQGQGAASGASEQRDPDGTRRVAVECDRCPRETLPPGLEAHQEYVRQWTQLAVASGMAPVKLLTLCPDCTKSFRLFMLSSEVRS